MKEGYKPSRSLRPEEVEVRIDSYGAKSITLVVYITARAAMYLLDDRFGADEWSRTLEIHQMPSGGYYALCTIEVQIDGNTVTRQDIGEDDNSPKAAASDALKRAATNFIPSLRALYTLPTIRVTAKQLDIPISKDSTKEDMKKAVKYKNFKVSSLSFGNSAAGLFVKTIQIVDTDTGAVVCNYTSDIRELKKESTETLQSLKKKMKTAHMTEDQMLMFYDVESLDQITENESLLKDALIRLKEREGEIAAKMAAKDGTKTGSSINQQLKRRKKEA